MSTDTNQELLADWEDVFRQGLLTFWMFVSLSDQPQTVSSLASSITSLTTGQYTPSKQAMYRQLRRHQAVELVVHQELPSSHGPPRKQYQLSTDGGDLLREFVNRNITLFDQPIINKLKESK